MAHDNSAVFGHPDGGVVTLDGTMLAVPGDDLTAVVLTAAPGSRDAARLGELVAGFAGPAVLRVGQPGPRAVRCGPVSRVTLVPG